MVAITQRINLFDDDSFSQLMVVFFVTNAVRTGGTGALVEPPGSYRTLTEYAPGVALSGILNCVDSGVLPFACTVVCLIGFGGMHTLPAQSNSTIAAPVIGPAPSFRSVYDTVKVSPALTSVGVVFRFSILGTPGSTSLETLNLAVVVTMVLHHVGIAMECT